ncbi:unnamed protein product, partial [Scytosiphon promiscuus]
MAKRRRRSVRLLCYVAGAVGAAAASSHREDEFEAVTLGALQPPLLPKVRQSGGALAGRERAALHRDESPDQTIDRLLRHMIERESQRQFSGGDGIHPDVLPSSAAAAAADAAAAAAAAVPASSAPTAAAESESSMRAEQRGAFREEEGKTDIPPGSATAEAGHVPHDEQHGDRGQTAKPSSMEVVSSPREGEGVTASGIEDREETAAAEAASIPNDVDEEDSIPIAVGDPLEEDAPPDDGSTASFAGSREDTGVISPGLGAIEEGSSDGAHNAAIEGSVDFHHRAGESLQEAEGPSSPDVSGTADTEVRLQAESSEAGRG